MTRLATTTIHQSSELNARYRQILDEAKATGLARLRDSDGTAILIMPESVIASLEGGRESSAIIVSCIRSLLPLERAVVGGVQPSLRDLGDWPWLEEFDLADLGEFVEEMRGSLERALPTLDATPIVQSLTGWRTTADAMSDPLSRETLLGANHEKDYVEVGRPA